MQPTFVIVGRFQREYILPASGQPMLDSPGGDLLYAAGGLAVWEKDIGLIARVSEDLPRQWLRSIDERGFDTRGIHILPEVLDMRYFVAYTDFEHASQATPVAHFARRQMTFPKALLGYQPPSDKDPRQADPLTPMVSDIPADYMDARAVHICPLDPAMQSRIAASLRRGSVTTITVDPGHVRRSSNFTKELRLLLQGTTSFLPSEGELRALFWGETHDLWEMAEAISAYGCETIVVKRGAQGQLVYDAAGRHRWEIPAYDARRVDPTGSGDAFCGGYLAGYQKNFDPLDAALHGSVSASLKMEGSGPFYPADVLPGLAQARYLALKDLVREL
ncbi:MAG: carbohydrate kinase family protein [Bacteroidota bacterium]